MSLSECSETNVHHREADEQHLFLSAVTFTDGHHLLNTLSKITQYVE